jgi:AAA+ superfamily predicted ATPase
MSGCVRVILVFLLVILGALLLGFSQRYDNSFMKVVGIMMIFAGFILVLIFRHEDKTGEKIFEVRKNEKSSLTKEYYELLILNASELKLLLAKINSDSIIYERIKSTGYVDNKEDCSYLIDHCMVYDLKQIYNLFNDSNNHKSLKAMGFWIVVHFLSWDRDSEPFKWPDIQTTYQIGIDDSIIFDKNYYSVNHFKISISESDNDDEICTFSNCNLLFSLPAFLKAVDSPLLKEYAILMYRFANIISEADCKIGAKEQKQLQIIFEALHHPIPENIDSKKIFIEINDTDNNVVENNFESTENLIVDNCCTYDDILFELDLLIGLQPVKEEINTLINFIKVQKKRSTSGLKTSPISYHIVFTGNPGTGKTTVARIISKLYKQLGILAKGHLVETDRSGLVAEYLGQTAPKVNETVNSALDGILFIDEAYSLVGEDKDDFGKEAVATLIKRMEDDRERLVVVLAGYTEEMKRFIDTNPGFESRFNRYIEFPDYTPDELLAIFESKCKQLEYILTPEAKTKAEIMFENAYQKRTKSFGNARLVRNLFEKTIEIQANRISKLTNVTKEKLITIEADDFL